MSTISNKTCSIGLTKSSHQRFIRSSAFLASKNKPRANFSHKKASIDPFKLLSKYFGRKVILISKKSDIVHFYKKSKYFTRFEVNNISYVIERPHVTIHTSAPQIIKSSFRSKGDFIHLVGDLYVNKKHYNKILPAGQKRIALQPECRLVPHQVRKMTSIKNLRMNLKARELRGYFKFILSLRSLEVFDLRITDERELMSDDALCLFFSKILELKSLRVFKLQILCCNISPNFMTHLLLEIERLKIKRWHIQAQMDLWKLVEAKQVSRVLQKVDFLGIECFSRKWDYSCCYHPYHECNVDPIIIEKLIDQNKRALNIHFDGDDYRKDLRGLLGHFWALKTLYVNVQGDFLIWSEEKEKQHNQILWTKLLKNVILNSNKRTYVQSADQNEVKVSDSINTTFLSLLNVLKSQNSDLNFVRIFSCENCISRNKNDEDNRAIHKTESFIDQLRDLQSPQEIQLTFNTRLGQQTLKDLFWSLKSLKKLDLNLYPQKLFPWDEDIPFDALSNLTDFKIVIQRNKKNCYNPVLQKHGDPDWELDEDDDGKKFIWGKCLAKNISKLTKLQVFELKNKPYGIGSMNVKAFFGILKGCCNLRNLRSLIISLPVSKMKDPEDSEGFMPDLWHSHINQSRSILEQDIYQRTRQIIEVNPELEVINIDKLDIYDIEFIKHKC